MLCRLGLCEWMRSAPLRGCLSICIALGPPLTWHVLASVGCNVCVCTRHEFMLHSARLLTCLCAVRSPSATSPTTGSPSPCRTHKSGALLSTYKCTLLGNSMVQHKGGTTWELRAIGDFPNGAVLNIKVKSHYVAKGTIGPAKAAFTALDKLIAAAKAPVEKKKRAARTPQRSATRRVTTTRRQGQEAPL